MGSLIPLEADNGAAAELVSIHTEMVMAIGLTPSSEISQRLANARMQVFAARLAAAEKEQGTRLAAVSSRSGVEAAASRPPARRARFSRSLRHKPSQAYLSSACSLSPCLR
jgi:hypothetical protein